MDWLTEQSEQFRDSILFVAIDPATVYAKAVRTPGLLPNAPLVVDHFHLVKLANDCVTKVRRRTIWEQKGRRGRNIDPAWGEPTPTAHRPATSERQGVRGDVEQPDGRRPVRADPRRLDRERGVALVARDGPHQRIPRGDLRAALVFYNWCASTTIDELHTLAGTVET